jgi:hypothetical protein
VRLQNALLLALAMTCACKKAPTEADAGADAGVKVTAQLPLPFAAVHLGMTEADLRVLFPPLEDVPACAPKLAGGDVPVPTQVPGSEKKARARCARAVDIAGMTVGEWS